MKIFVNSFYYPIYTLGPGKRIGLWLQGCSIRCKNCISPHTWLITPKHEIEIEKLAQEINFFPSDKLTISGGEPLDQSQNLIEFLKLVRKNKKDILLYTGYILNEYIQKNGRLWNELKNLVDVIIDGPFIWGKETKYIWKGSENQKMYILNKKLLPIYKQYKNKTKNKKLQIIEYDNNLFLVGIPYQKDYYRIIETIRNM
ncbi:MAG: 4Fe-4S single cluster domain-containing protein [Candidatus Calescibacterium sp.]|nr:radical SAM protein [Candidatus Calescibacterium sp.]MDW8132798.1 4Fe-4S single cluster domain-containing protein [Candidatus Calescibacterium sp.]